MPQVPDSLESTIKQAKAATQLALESGVSPIQIELLIPEIALQAQALAEEFIPLFEGYGSGLKVFFPDTGAAALARRDWGETTFKVSDLGSRNTPVETKIKPEDEAFLVVCPSSVEVYSVEKLCNLAAGRPVVLLIPQLEDVAIVGIGYAARELRTRFLNYLESCYYLRPLDGVMVIRSYPEPWQVWQEKGDQYELVAETPEKPAGEALEMLLNRANPLSEGETPAPAKKSGLFSSIQSFLKALSQ